MAHQVDQEVQAVDQAAQTAAHQAGQEVQAVDLAAQTVAHQAALEAQAVDLEAQAVAHRVARVRPEVLHLQTQVVQPEERRLQSVSL